MRKLCAVAVLMMLAGSAEAGEPRGGLFAAPTALDYFTGVAVPPPVRLQPVVGSVQRTGRFTNPFTHKARYKSLMFNPLQGTFGWMKYRR